MNNTKPAILIAYTGEIPTHIEAVLVPKNWDGDVDSLPFSVASNHIITDSLVRVNPAILSY